MSIKHLREIMIESPLSEALNTCGV